MARLWNMKEVSALKTDAPVKELASVLGRSPSSIYHARMRNKISAEWNIRIYAEDIAQMMMLAESGWSYRDIGKVKNRSRESVKFAIRNARKHGFDAYPKREF